MMEQDFYVIDDFLPDAEANLFHDTFFSDRFWKVYWNRNKGKENWNWHRSIANDVKDMGDINDRVEQLDSSTRMLWDHVDELLFNIVKIKQRLVRYYSNSHTYGQDGHIHRDDGDLTVLYYPCRNWKTEWEGGTSFYNEEITDCIKYVSYKFNRLVVFRAGIPHRAMPVTRDCYELRTSLVFKTDKDTNHPSYFEWYNSRRN